MGGKEWTQPRGQGRIRIRKQVWYSGPIHRMDIANAVSLSIPAVANTINDMLESGEVCEQRGSASRDGKLGRRASVVDIVADFQYFIGIEMRRDSRHICLTDYRGKVLETAEEAVSYPEYDDNIASVCRLARTFMDHLPVPIEKVQGICVSLPGVVDYENGLLTAHSLYGWYNKAVARDLMMRLGWKGPVIVENDGCTRAFGVRMLHRNGFRGVKTFAYLMIARGISCPFLSCDAADVEHPMGIGELGHMVIRAEEALTDEKFNGNLSSLAGERAIMNFCQEAIQAGKAPLLHRIAKEERPTIPQILQAQQEGDPDVNAILQKAFFYLAVALANVYNFVQPDLIFVDSRLFSNKGNRSKLVEHMQQYLYTTHKMNCNIEFVEPQPEYGAQCAALCAIRNYLDSAEDMEINRMG